MIKPTLVLLAAAYSVTAFMSRNSAVKSATGPLTIDSIASPTGLGSAEPNLTVAADGRVYMSWLQSSDSGSALRFAVFDGARWSAARTIVASRDFFVNWADFPSLEVLDSMHLAAHWLQRNGRSTYAYGVRIAQSNNGGVTWRAPLTPHRDFTQTEHGFVTMWHEGTTLSAAWLDGRKFSTAGHDPSNEMSLVTTTISPNGTRGREVRLDERTCDCCQNAAAMTSAGPIIAYRNRSTDEIRDIYLTRRVAGAWTAGVAVHNDRWKIAACPVNGPAIAARGHRVALAWFTAPNDSARVNVAFSDNDGATFGTPTRVDGGDPAGRVDVSVLADGGALVTWVERAGGDVAQVRARRVTRDGKGGAMVTIASSTAARASGFPKSVVTGTTVLFAWTLAGKPSIVRVARASLSEFK